MTTAVRAIAPTVVDEPMDFTLVATAPAKNNHDQPAQGLPAQGLPAQVLPEQVPPADAGRHVDPRPPHRIVRRHREARQRDQPVMTYDATEYADVDFPLKLAKAEIHKATNATLKSKIFDRLGVMRRKART